jgi:hypothetical protein
MAQYKRPTRSQDGFSLATVMLIALAVILGSVAMIDRATSGWLGSLFVGQSREARDAAEIGLARVVSELNRSRNRRLLVNAAALNITSLTDLQADASKFRSYCETSSPNLGEFARNGITKIVDGEHQITNPPGSTSATSRYYRVVKIEQPAESKELNEDFSKNDTFNIANKGELSITVEGIVRRGDTVLARSTIQETLEVVPKCCKRSFSGENGALGNDTRECDWPPAGVTIGTAQDPSRPGELTAKGYAVNFNALNDGQPLPYVLCASTSTSACESELNANNPTQIKNNPNVIFKSIDALTTNRLCEKKEGTPMPDECNITLDPKELNLNTLTLTLDGSETLSISEHPPNWPEKFKNVCIVADEDEGGTERLAIHCSINRLDFGGNNVIIDIQNSTSTPIRIHFPNAQIPSSTKTIDQRNNGEFQHSGTPLNLSLLGCTTCEIQYVDIGSGNSQAMSLFAYFKQGVVTIGGNAGYEGVLWANEVIANGNVNFDVPAGAVEAVLELLDMDSPGIDWVARSVKSTKLFSP